MANLFTGDSAGFEGGTVGTWTFAFSQNLSNTDESSATTAAAHSGTHSLKIAPVTIAPGFTQADTETAYTPGPFTCSPSTTYTFSCWVKPKSNAPLDLGAYTTIVFLFTTADPAYYYAYGVKESGTVGQPVLISEPNQQVVVTVPADTSADWYEIGPFNFSTPSDCTQMQMYLAWAGVDGTLGNTPLRYYDDFSLDVFVPSPPNDDWVDAAAISSSLPTDTWTLAADGSTVGATTEPGEIFTSGQTVWFSWTAPSDGGARFNIGDALYLTASDPYVRVFTGGSIGSAVLVAQTEPGFTGPAVFDATSGVEYHIQVDMTPANDLPYLDPPHEAANFTLFLLFEPAPPPPPPRNLLPRGAGRGRLGCGVNEAYITWKCGTPRFCPVLNASEVTYARHLNDISEAQVVVPISGTSEDECCECLGDLEPWCHELHIARDGKDVWLGPITEVVYEYSQVTIRALDLLGWATVRVSEIPIDYTAATGAGPADWTTIGRAVLDVAFAEDDPCLLPYVSASPSGYVGEQKFNPYDLSAFDQLDQLAQSGLEYTTVGRTVVLSSPNVPTTPIATLLDEHILGAVQLTKTGLLQADRWYVHFQDDTSAIPPGPGLADAPDKYCYGLIERIRSTDTALANAASADVVAGIYLGATAIAPRLLEIPDGSQLSPEAPWTIDAMIPGVRVDVGVTRLCVPATQSFRLTGVQVRQSEKGEEITVTLGPLNVLSAGL